MEFEWSPIPPEAWRDMLRDAPRANLLQSWPYAVAARIHDQMMSRRALIRDAGRTVGLMQIQEIRIGPIHILRLHRGPLWLAGKESPARWQSFLTAFNAAFPRRLGRRRQIMPEIEEGPDAEELLAGAGLKRRGPEPYRTIVLDLAPSLDELRAKLKAKWRNTLRQAERGGLSVATDRAGEAAPSFLAGYDADKSARGYRGAKPQRLATLTVSAAPLGDVFILSALRGEAMVAAVMLFRHGNAATYQAGWTGPEGRKLRAHHLLLWSAIGELKAAGVERLDLGGIHPRMAEGVTRFKQGLGGQAVTLAGLYG